MANNVSFHYLADPKNETLLRNALVNVLAQFAGTHDVTVIGSQSNLKWEVVLKTGGGGFTVYLEGPEQHTVEATVRAVRTLLEQAGARPITAV